MNPLGTLGIGFIEFSTVICINLGSLCAVIGEIGVLLFTTV